MSIKIPRLPYTIQAALPHFLRKHIPSQINMKDNPGMVKKIAIAFNKSKGKLDG
jgi:hypothetical protein